MNKDEILALIYKCDAIISNYLSDNSFDATKVTEAKLKQWKLQMVQILIMDKFDL